MLTLCSQTGVQRSRNFHIIISIDTKNIFNHIAITLHVYTIRRNSQCQSFCRFIGNLHFQAGHNALDCLYRNHFTYQRMYFFVSKIDDKILCRSSEYIFYFRRNRTASQFFHHQSSQFQAINHAVRIDTTFETERSIRIQAMTTSRLTHPCRMEISTFDEYVCRSFRRTGVQSTEYAGNTHGLFLVANHQVAFVQLTFHFIQRNERSTFGHCFHNHFVAFNLSGIEAMQRLTESMNDIVRNIHYIINRAHTDQAQFVLQPFRTLLHRYTFHDNTGIMRTSFAVFNLHFDIQVMVFHFKAIH